MRIIDFTFALSRNTITRNYQETQIIINLFFIIKELLNRLIYCDINQEIKNSSNYLLIKTILNLKA